MTAPHGSTKQPWWRSALSKCFSSIVFIYLLIYFAGSPVTYTNWAKAEPSKVTHRCAIMSARLDYQWDDVDCMVEFNHLCTGGEEIRLHCDHYTKLQNLGLLCVSGWELGPEYG